jgi:succinoglycan biosynthesis protein ExoM
MTMSPQVRDHVSVCVCTFKRPDMLRQLLRTLSRQDTRELIDYSVIVIDNDAGGSGRACVEQARQELAMDIAYEVEPTNTIPAARNHALRLATGNYIGIIDDDEIAPADWLVTLYNAINAFGVDGALGPVHPFFAHVPPPWLVKSGLCERPVIRTGTLLRWDDTRTGNVLLKRAVFTTHALRFDENCRTSGSDKEFFREAMDRGSRFVAVAEAPVFEHVPPERQTFSYYVRRNRIQASNERKFRAPLLRGAARVTAPAKAAAALLVYCLALPPAALLGRHHAVTYALKIVYHGSWLLTMLGLDLARHRNL